MPNVMENGNKDLQLQALILMGKIHLKMGSLQLEGTLATQEESKISDE